ncbi:MAG TPA: hypothetical protein VF171_08905 [Trueperaceae bacterium]
MDQTQRRDYHSVIRSIIDQAEAMEDPGDDQEMLFDRVQALSEKVEELQALLDEIYA